MKLTIYTDFSPTVRPKKKQGRRKTKTLRAKREGNWVRLHDVPLTCVIDKKKSKLLMASLSVKS